MNFKITKLQIKILKWIATKIVIQSCQHKKNIIMYYKILGDAARKEFTEDNKITLDSFLSDCFNTSINKENL